jgi:hypothetical protein
MRPADDTEPASWIAERLHPFAQDVGAIIPTGFEAYARVFHPAYRRMPDGTLTPVRWQDIAAANGRSIKEEMGRMDISTLPAEFSSDGKRLWDDQPRTGRMPFEIASRFVALLGRHTSTPESCWFAPWRGFGWLRVPERDAAKFSLPNRDMVLLHGRLEDVLQTLEEVDWIYLAPSLWWPEDRAWFVATEIDFNWSYVGGTRDCIQSILDDPHLEALPTNPNEGNSMEK